MDNASRNTQSVNRLDALEPTVQGLSDDMGKVKGRIDTSATVTLLASDLNGEVVTNSATSQSVVISDTLNAATEIHDKISVIQYGEGVTSITVTGAQITNGGTAALPLSAQYQGVVLTKIADNSWIATGAI